MCMHICTDPMTSGCVFAITAYKWIAITSPIILSLHKYIILYKCITLSFLLSTHTHRQLNKDTNRTVFLPLSLPLSTFHTYLTPNPRTPYNYQQQWSQLAYDLLFSQDTWRKMQRMGKGRKKRREMGDRNESRVVLQICICYTSS